MGLLNGGSIMSIVSGYRLVWVGGRFGGHKTSFAYYLAKQYLAQGYRLISNTKCIWNDDMENVELLPGSNHLKAVIVLDEGGLEFKATKQVEMIAAYANKMDCIYIIPSFWPPNRGAQVVTIQPLFNLKSAGVPAVFYIWRVKLGDFKDKGYFIWTNPNEIYGTYSRQDPGAEASDIVEFLVGRTEGYRARHGYAANKLSTVGVSEIDLLQEAANTMAAAADNFETFSGRKNGRRRF
jgi:hypothetical protein